MGFFTLQIFYKHTMLHDKIIQRKKKQKHNMFILVRGVLLKIVNKEDVLLQKR